MRQWKDLRSRLEIFPQFDGNFPAPWWKNPRSRQEHAPAPGWHVLRSRLEIFPQWAGNLHPLTPLFALFMVHLSL
jgi:hypothetical protein